MSFPVAGSFIVKAMSTFPDVCISAPCSSCRVYIALLGNDREAKFREPSRTDSRRAHLCKPSVACDSEQWFRDTKTGQEAHDPAAARPVFLPVQGARNFSLPPEIVEALQRPPQGADMDVEQGGNV